jgi:GR25 family glycosyltransferase involved in LPS biosynthesis
MVYWDKIAIANKGFLINLDERNDRLSESLDEFNKLNITGVERYPAIKITEDSDDGWIIRGCTQSHCNILKLQSENLWEKVIIFEDDFFLDIIHPEIKELNDDIIKNIFDNDFDLLMLGGKLRSDSHYENEFLIKPSSFTQATCYVSSLKFAKFVTSHFNYLDKSSVVYGEAIDSYFDNLLTKSHWRMFTDMNGIEELINNDLKIYFSSPILFNQRPSYSDIMNRYVNYSHNNHHVNFRFWPRNSNKNL